MHKNKMPIYEKQTKSEGRNKKWSFVIDKEKGMS